MDNVFLPTSSISNNGLDYLTNVGKCHLPKYKQLTNKKNTEVNVMSKNIHKNFEIRPAKSGQITKMDNVLIPTSSIPNYGLDYLTNVHKMFQMSDSAN